MARTETVKLAVAPTLSDKLAVVRPHLEASSTTSRLVAIGMTIQRGARRSGAINRAKTCIRGSKDPTMMHHAHRQRSSERRTHSHLALKSRKHVGTPPPRTVIRRTRHQRADKAGNCWIPSATSAHDTGRRTTPSRHTPSRTRRHRPISSLRAKARSWSCECCGRFRWRARNHCAKVLSSGTENRHANWIMPRRTRALPERGQPFLRRFLPLSSGEPVRPA